MFETWLYASAFHQDEKRQLDLETLRSFEPSASLTLQLVVCQLAIATVNLDALVRYLLGQPTRDLANHAEQDTAFGLL